MKRQLSLIFVALILRTPASFPLQENPKASIQGVVMSSATGEPIERAQISVTRINPPPPAPGQAIPAPVSAQIVPVMTGNDGKFKFELEPGQYRLRVQRNGYATQEYGQRVSTGPGQIISLVAGQTMKEVLFKLVPSGVVTGRVRDFRGEAIPGVQVSLLRTTYNSLGQRTLASSGGATTDDRGEYRIFWIPPGRYMLSVGMASRAVSALVFNQTVLADRNFPTTYYPGTIDPTRAVTLDVQPGRELTGIDVVVNSFAAFRIRGKLTDGTTGQPARTASISLVPRQDPNSIDAITNSATRPTTFNPNGTFEIRDVLPGSYWLRAQSSTSLDGPINPNLVANIRNASELLETVIGNRSSAQIPVDVTGDLDGVTLTLMPGISIPLQLSVDGMELASVEGYERTRILLRPTTTGMPTAAQRSSFAAEGTGMLLNVQPGEYRIQASLPQPDLYVKEAIFERSDVLNSAWEVTSMTSGTLSIVLGTKAGQIEGNLTDTLIRPVAGNTVLLIPDEHRDRPELYKSALSDQNGNFVFRGIPPGGYKVFAWEEIEPNAWYDRELLSRYEQQGGAVRIQEGSKESIEVKIIPATR